MATKPACANTRFVSFIYLDRFVRGTLPLVFDVDGRADSRVLVGQYGTVKSDEE